MSAIGIHRNVHTDASERVHNIGKFVSREPLGNISDAVGYESKWGFFVGGETADLRSYSLPLFVFVRVLMLTHSRL